MSTTKHYDVVILGAGIGALAAAALLARRSWRVLVLGNGFRKPKYSYDGLVLSRRPFTFLSASSPAWGRVLVELAQSQSFRRRLSPLEPMLQFLGPDLRLDVPPDAALFAREIDREFPAVRRAVDELYAELARANSAADAAFERDAVWPPGTFWERRETARVVASLPYVDGTSDFLTEFPQEHAFRDVVRTPARFASHAAGELPPFAMARLHGAWTRGVSQLAGGEEELIDYLVERVRTHGGDARLGERATSLVHRGGKVRGVHIDGDEAAVGASFVVSDLSTPALFDLVPSLVVPRDKGRAIDVPETRFVVSMVVRTAGLPKPLAVESFLVPKTGPVVHLQKAPGASAGTTLLIAEAIVPAGAPLARLREQVFGTVLAYLPFFERHVLLCDSPHDGLPLWDFRNATDDDPSVGPRPWGLRVRLVDRAQMRAFGASSDPEPMVPRFRVTPPQLEGLAGEPIRTPLGGVFVTGKSVLPALGQEGELLAAWGVARVITRTDRRKEKMLREMWSKVELS